MRILIIEDDPAIARTIKTGLQQEAFAVDVATDGAEGLAAATGIAYDLLVMDIMLPNMNGLEVLRALREQAESTPILLLSAKDKVDDKVRGLNSGADDYLSKPFSFEELLARVHALLRRPHATKGVVLFADDLSLDIISGEVTRAGKAIALSAKEFAILEYLLRNKNRLVSKKELLDHVWDFDADILLHTVEVFVGYLRAKIDKPFNGQNLLHTVRGLGYKIKSSS